MTPVIDWSNYTPRQVFDAIRSAPLVAGPWENSGGEWARRAGDGFFIAIGRRGRYVVRTSFGDVAFATREAADKKLKSVGYALAGGAYKRPKSAKRAKRKS